MTQAGLIEAVVARGGVAPNVAVTDVSVRVAYRQNGEWRSEALQRPAGMPDAAAFDLLAGWLR